MLDPRRCAISYLRSPADAFWRWADGGQVVVWFDGSTVAFREEIENVLNWLAPQGLPPFASIVMLMAACRGKTPDKSLFISAPQAQSDASQPSALIVTAMRKQMQAPLEAALHQLQRITVLPRELVANQHAKAILAEVVFESSRVERLTTLLSNAIIRGLAESIEDSELNEPVSAVAKTNHIRHLHIISEGLKPHDSHSLTLRLKAGLDELPEAADVDLAPAQRAAKLLVELKDDEDFGGLMRVTRDLMAALQLPRALSEIDNLAVGGVSDITNRGSLDRLLLSELAHDDLTLSVRVALNEALYLRREPPVRRPSTRLSLLIDGSVRNWGVTRVLSTAVGLAAIAREKQHAGVQAFRLGVSTFEPIDLLTKKGLADHFNRIEPSIHPGAALESFFAEQNDLELDDIILVTQREVALDPDFRRSLSRVEGKRFFMATVDRDGSFALMATPFNSSSVLASAIIDVEKLFQSAAAKSVVAESKRNLLPVILGVRPFPFQLPLQRSIERTYNLANGELAALTDNSTLLHWKSKNRGSRTVATGLPHGRILWFGEAQPGRLGVLSALWENGSIPLAVIDLASGEIERFALAMRCPPQAVHQEGSVLILLYDTRCDAFSLSSGEKLSSCDAPVARWIRGRYYKSHVGWFFPLWDGMAISFQPVSLPKGVASNSIALIFDRKDVEGPWSLGMTGDIHSLNDGKLAPVKFSAEIQAREITISEDGHRLARTEKIDGKFSPLIDLNSMTRHDFSRQYVKQVLEAIPRPETRNIRRRFSNVYFHEGIPRLQSAKGTWVTLEIVQNNLLLQFCPAPERSVAAVSFEPHSSKIQEDCVLELAQFPHGGVFLDYRGILHVKSADGTLPEISIVLVEGSVAVWSSDGSLYGTRYFVEDRANCSALEIFQKIQKLGASLV